MESLIDEVLNLARPTSAKKEQQLVSDIRSNCVVNADRDMVATILRNLVFNAMKFSGNGKTIRIELDCVKSEVYMKVIDKGVGMDEKQMEKLFVVDEHVSTVGTSGELGSGLGLILCKDFAAKNGGRIEVESNPGKGSVFTLIMPCVKSIAKNE
ncbi:MAG TPA: hypothetical protein DIW50_00345 [Prolixibacteraceae bacterium]|nr:hypothetical protein [Prolixibacteraceae bacterium]